MNALTEILSHPFVHKLGWTLLHLFWQGAAVALLLGIALRLLRKFSANLRYVVACLALAFTILGFVVTFCLVSAPPDQGGIESAPLASLADPLLAHRTADMPVARAAEYMEIFTRTSWTQRVEAFFAPALPYIVAGWLLGVFALSLYHLGGWAHLQRLRRRLTKQADAALLAKLSTLAEELRVTRPVRLVESALVQIPTVVGWVRPVILLPATALTGLTSEQIEALLAHELAHIRRGDYLINMLQTVVEILGFYHPGIWWISNKIRLERENCCDDIAVATCGDKMHYATALAEMERIRSTQGELAMAANGGSLLMRIRRLIGKSPAPKSRFNWAAALITAAVIAAMAIPTTIALSRSRAADARTAPVVEKNDDGPDRITLEGDILVTMPQKGSNGQQDATLRASKLIMNLPGMGGLKGTPEIIAEGPITLTSPVQDSQADKAKAQILFEIKYYALPANSKLIKDAGKEGTFVRTDKAFAEQLIELSKKSKDAKVLTAPRVTVLEGEEAIFTVSNDIQYTSGYTEPPDGEPKPIIKTVHEGIDAKVGGKLVGDNAIFVRLLFTHTTPTLTSHKVAKGREIQIPIVRTAECATSVTVANNGVVIIGGFQSSKKDVTLVVQMVSHIVRKDDTGRLSGRLPIADSTEEVRFTVAPQLITSVRVDTEGVPAFADSRQTPAKAVKALIEMLRGQRSLSFELLDSKMAIAGQLDDLRKIVNEQSVEIEAAISDDKQALIVAKSLKDDRGREGQLVFHVTHKDGKWTVDDIDFDDPEGLEDKMKLFDEEMQKAKQVPTLSDVPGLGLMFEAASGPGVFETVNNLVNLSKSEILGGVDPKTKKQADELARILGDRELEVANTRALGQYAIVISKPMEAEGETGQLVFNLRQKDRQWVVEDIDFETPGGVRDEMKRFNDRPLKAVLGSPGMGGGFVEAPLSSDPKSTGASGKVAPRVYVLQHAKAAEIAVSLRDLVIGPEHKIVADETSNRLIVVADEPQHQQIERLIVQLDVAASKEAEETPPQVLVFELKYADSSELANVLTSLLTKEQHEVRIVPGPQPNHLLVRANKSNVEQMGKLIKLLDVPQAGTGTSAVDAVTRIVELRYADSQQVVTMLTNLSVLGRDCRVVSDARLNQLVIEAPEADLKRIMDLIEQIDMPADEKAAKRQRTVKDEDLAVLIDEREFLAEKMQSLRATISQLQQQLGITEFTKNQDLMLQRASSLLAELAKTESLRMQLEAQLSLLDKGKDPSVSPQERLKMRQEYVNSDATVKALAEKIAQVEMDLLLAQQEKGGDHPEIKRNVNLLEALKNRLVEAKDEVVQAFDKLMVVQADKTRQQNIARARAEIEQNMTYEKKLRTRLDQETKETNAMAQSQLQVQGLRDELDTMKAMYDEVNRRITDLRMQPQMPMLYEIDEAAQE